MVKPPMIISMDSRKDIQICHNGQFPQYFEFETCAQCGLAGIAKKIKSCSGCFDIGYCSKGCQKKHWKAEHRLSCRQNRNHELDKPGSSYIDRVFLANDVMSRIKTLPDHTELVGLELICHRDVKRQVKKILKLCGHDQKRLFDQFRHEVRGWLTLAFRWFKHVEIYELLHSVCVRVGTHYTCKFMRVDPSVTRLNFAVKNYHYVEPMEHFQPFPDKFDKRTMYWVKHINSLRS